jgi:hypothetical protein
MRKVTGGTVPAQMWKAVMLAAEADAPIAPLDRSPIPPVIQSEQVTGPAYLDDPMPGATIVDSAAYHLPEIANTEPPPPPIAPVFAPVSAPIPAPPPATSPGLSEPPNPARTAGAQIAARPVETYAPPAPEPPARPQPVAEATPPAQNASPDGDALYRQRETEYRRILRQATSPTLDEDTPSRQRASEPRQIDPPASSHRDLPFPQ